jgi:hypothetical protein
VSGGNWRCSTCNTMNAPGKTGCRNCAGLRTAPAEPPPPSGSSHTRVIRPEHRSGGGGTVRFSGSEAPRTPRTPGPGTDPAPPAVRRPAAYGSAVPPSRSADAPTPPGFVLPSPAAEDPPGPGSRPQRRKLLIGVLAAMAVLAAGGFGVAEWVRSGPATGADGSPAATAPPTAPDAAPCPARVAASLPGDGAASVLVAAYTTDRFLVTLCRAADGTVYYDGQARNRTPSSATRITLPATLVSGCWLAVNHAFAYRVGDGRLTVEENGGTLYSGALTPAADPS